MKTNTAFTVNAPKVVHETIEGEVVVVNLEKGDYYSLVKTGAYVWNEIIRGTSQGDIIEEMIRHYDASHDHIENAVNEFLERLQQEELIIPKSPNESKSPTKPEGQEQTNARTEKLDFEPPSLQKYTDMEELLALDPIHEVDEIGWPNAKVGV